jgi:hypothetical protein
MPNKENCGNFEQLSKAFEKPYNSLRAAEWLSVGQECMRICGTVREDCTDAIRQDQKNRQVLDNL